MLYISHLLEDEDMRQLIMQTEMGVESIEFSISDNLDQLEKKIGEYDLWAKTKHSARTFNSIEIRNSAGIK